MLRRCSIKHILLLLSDAQRRYQLPHPHLNLTRFLRFADDGDREGMILERAGPKPSRKRTLSTRWGHGGYRALGSLLHLDLVAVFTGSCCQSKYATCLGWRAAGVLPTSTSENRNQASLKPSERVMVNRRVTCRGEVKSVYFTPGSEMLCTVPGGGTKKVSEVRHCLGSGTL